MQTGRPVDYRLWSLCCVLPAFCMGHATKVDISENVKRNGRTVHQFSCRLAPPLLVGSKCCFWAVPPAKTIAENKVADAA
jgi:hypothetical protein